MERPGLHPRNRHRSAYDFKKLCEAHPTLQRFVSANPYGQISIDFADSAAVMALNQAILLSQYHIQDWHIPKGFLCPPIPGRADYLHHIADLLASDQQNVIPRGHKVVVCDLGVGASAIYPLLGQREYGWSFVGSDSESTALAAAQRNLKANPDIDQQVQLRHQKHALRIFSGIVHPRESFDVCICNPPFHASAAEAAGETQRKWRNLSKAESKGSTKGGQPHLNFGGQQKELWCEGGEMNFIGRLIAESAQHRDLCLWFTSLVSKEKHLPRLQQVLESHPVFEYRIIDMLHGQKHSRILAWTFLNQDQRSAKGQERWR